MGFYIETDGPKNKATWLVNNHGAKVVDNKTVAIIVSDESSLEGCVCVVDNGPFEAAGYIYDKQELESFLREDGRIKVWLKMNKEKAKELSRYKDYLEEKNKR